MKGIYLGLIVVAVLSLAVGAVAGYSISSQNRSSSTATSNMQSSDGQITVSGSVNLFAGDQAPIRVDFTSASGNYSAYINPVSTIDTQASECYQYAITSMSVAETSPQYSYSCQQVQTQYTTTASSGSFSIQLPNNEAFTVTIISVDVYSGLQGSCSAGTLNLDSTTAQTTDNIQC